MKSKSYLTIIFATLSLAVVGSVAVMGLLTASITINSSGTVQAVNVEVFWDASCTNPVNQVDWGNLSPGDSVSRNMYIKNTGNIPLTLNMSTSGWNPIQAGSYISLSWNREGDILNPGNVAEATLSLQVSNSISGVADFTFNIIIQGSG